MSETNQPIVLDFAQLGRLIINDLNNATSGSSTISANYSKEQLIGFMQNPDKSEKQLRNLSNYFYNASPNYKRLIQYFAGLPTFDHIVEPYDLDKEKVNLEKFKKQYYKTLKLIEIMNLPHEFSKILSSAFREDTFFGYEHMTADSYFIQKLNNDYCKITSLEDGVFNFSFDFSYFDKFRGKIDKYPEEFQKKYNLYQNDKTNMKWQELSAENTICIKINESIEYSFPPFATIFEAVFDIDESKKLKRVKDKMDNYMILTQQIPIDENSGETNKFLIDLETAVQFHNKASQSLPDEVGLVTSPMKIEAIKLERKNNDSDNVAQATRALFDDAGVSQFLFNSDKSTNTGVNKSILTDEQIIFAVLKQFQRWVNRKLKYFNTSYKFRVEFLKTTENNRQDVFENYLKAAQYGFPTKHATFAALGHSPSSLENMVFLENQVLGLTLKLEPLSSSHTTSGKDGAGAPSKNDNDISESGEKTRENDGNVRE